MKYRLSGNPRGGMHIVRRINTKSGSKGLCGRKVGQKLFYHLPNLEPIKQDEDDDPLCASCYGHYVNQGE